MIVQNTSLDGHTDITFTISRKDLPQTLRIMDEVAKKTGASEVLHDVSVAKVSAIGVGMRNHSGVAARAFAALTQEGINILMISTSEIKITLLIQEKYLELVKKIKNKMPDISLTTDIIVGFPGETEEDFEETLDVVRKVRYDSVYSFIYSKRTGTPAAAMEDQVPEEVVKDRFERLLKTIQEISREITERKVGEVVDVLMEEVNDHDDSLITGRLSSNAVVHCKGTAACIGNICKVRLTESKGFYFMGEIIPCD